MPLGEKMRGIGEKWVSDVRNSLNVLSEPFKLWWLSPDGVPHYLHGIWTEGGDVRSEVMLH